MNGCAWHTEPGDLKPLIDDPGCSGVLNRVHHKDPSKPWGTSWSHMCDAHVGALNEGVVLEQFPIQQNNSDSRHDNG